MKNTSHADLTPRGNRPPYGLALEAFERYLAKGGDEIQGERQKEVLEEVDRLRRMVGSMEVTAPRSCIVLIDDVERGGRKGRGAASGIVPGPVPFSAVTES